MRRYYIAECPNSKVDYFEQSIHVCIMIQCACFLQITKITSSDVVPVHESCAFSQNKSYVGENMQLLALAGIPRKQTQNYLIEAMTKFLGGFPCKADIWFVLRCRATF